MTNWGGEAGHDFDFAGIFRTHLDQDFPFLQMKWQSWKTRPARHDLSIARGEVSEDAIPLDEGKLVRDGAYQIVFENGTYEVGPASITCSGDANEFHLDHYVITPVINRMIAKNGNYLAHASGVSIDDQVIIFPGITGSGKTSVLLELLSRGASYVGNENIFFDRGGRCTTYDPIISFSERNAALFPELLGRLFPDEKERRRQERRLSFHRLGQSLEGGHFFTRWVKENILSRSNFSCDAAFDKVFPGCPTRTSGEVAYAFLLERSGAQPSILKARSDEAAALVVASEWARANNGGYSHNILAELAGLKFCHKADYQDLFADFFGKAECYRMRIPPNASRDNIRRTVDMMQDIAGRP
jgi:hypothetical protein